MLDTGAQAYEFLSAIYAGIIIGIIYGICRIIRCLCRNNRIIAGIIDTLFWIICSAITFFAMYIINGARPRWYLFLGIILGILLHFCSFGIIINKIVKKITVSKREKDGRIDDGSKEKK